MALSALKTWAAAEILTATDLNAEFNNIYANGESLSFPATSSKDFDGFELILDSDGDTSITADTDDVIHFRLAGSDLFTMDGDVASAANGLNFVASAAANPVQVLVTGTADRGITFDAVDGEQMLILGATTAAVNEVTITSAAAATNPTIASSGATADTGIDFENDQNEPMLVLEPVAGGVNEITISNAASGNNPTIACTNVDAGGDDDQGITFQNQDGEEMLILDSVAASVNEVTITSAAAGGNPSIAATGGDGDADLLIDADGAGNVTIGNVSTGVVELGNAQIQFPNTDGAAGNYILVTDGSLVASFESNVIGTGTATSTVIPLPPNHLSGLTLTRTDGDTITIAAGACRNTGDDTNMVLAASLAKDTTSAWTAGAGGGMIAAGEQASTVYHVFLIEDGSGTVDAGFDTSLTAANLLSDSSYTKFRRVGSIITDATPDILDFTQVGNKFVWAAAVVTTHTDPDGTARLATMDVPTGLKLEVDFRATVRDADNSSAVALYSPDGDNTQPSNSNGFASVVTQVGGLEISGNFRLLTDTSGRIGYRANEVVDSFKTATTSWIDTRGKDD